MFWSFKKCFLINVLPLLLLLLFSLPANYHIYGQIVSGNAPIIIAPGSPLVPVPPASTGPIVVSGNTPIIINPTTSPSLPPSIPAPLPPPPVTPPPSPTPSPPPIPSPATPPPASPPASTPASTPATPPPATPPATPPPATTPAATPSATDSSPTPPTPVDADSSLPASKQPKQIPSLSDPKDNPNSVQSSPKSRITDPKPKTLPASPYTSSDSSDSGDEDSPVEADSTSNSGGGIPTVGILGIILLCILTASVIGVVVKRILILRNQLKERRSLQEQEETPAQRPPTSSSAPPYSAPPSKPAASTSKSSTAAQLSRQAGELKDVVIASVTTTTTKPKNTAVRHGPSTAKAIAAAANVFVPEKEKPKWMTSSSTVPTIPPPVVSTNNATQPAPPPPPPPPPPAPVNIRPAFKGFFAPPSSSQQQQQQSSIQQQQPISGKNDKSASNPSVGNTTAKEAAVRVTTIPDKPPKLELSYLDRGLKHSTSMKKPTTAPSKEDTPSYALKPAKSQPELVSPRAERPVPRAVVVKSNSMSRKKEAVNAAMVNATLAERLEDTAKKTEEPPPLPPPPPPAAAAASAVVNVTTPKKKVNMSKVRDSVTEKKGQLRRRGSDSSLYSNSNRHSRIEATKPTGFVSFLAKPSQALQHVMNLAPLRKPSFEHSVAESASLPRASPLLGASHHKPYDLQSDIASVIMPSTRKFIPPQAEFLKSDPSWHHRGHRRTHSDLGSTVGSVLDTGRPTPPPQLRREGSREMLYLPRANLLESVSGMTDDDIRSRAEENMMMASEYFNS